MTYEQFLRDAAECEEDKGIQVRTGTDIRFARKASRSGLGMILQGGPITVFIMDERKRDAYLKEYYCGSTEGGASENR